MSAPAKGPRKDGDLLTRILLRFVTDPRDREELRTGFEALRRRGGHGRLWYWREMARTVWALHRDPTWAAHPLRSLVASAWGDVLYGARLMARTPSVSLVTIPTLALAVGATTALFSFADALLLRPLAVREPDRLVALHHVRTTGNRVFSSFSWPDFVDLRDGARVPEDIAAWSTVRVRLGEGRDAAPVDGLVVSGNWFEVLGSIRSRDAPSCPRRTVRPTPTRWRWSARHSRSAPGEAWAPRSARR